MGKSKAFVIFSGNNQRAVIAFCRFATRSQIPFYIISSGENDTIYQTVYAKHVVLKRASRSLKYTTIKDMLTTLAKDKHLEELIVLPSTEYLNRFLLRHKNEFLADHIRIPLVDIALYEQISDKYSFSKRCSEYGLSVPEENTDFHNLSFPLVIKPKRYFNEDMEVQFKPVIAYNKKAFERYAREIDFSECYFQQYIDGPSFYLLYYISQEENEHIIFSQENLVQQADGGSMIAAVPSDLHHKQIANNYLNLFLEMDFYGLVMVELKCDDGQYYMIEANPRLWGPSQLFVDAGIPIFNNFVKDLGFAANETEFQNEDVKYFWYGGMAENYRSGKPLKFYNYSKDELIRELPEWMNYEVYRKDDANQIFINECLKAKTSSK